MQYFLKGKTTMQDTYTMKFSELVKHLNSDCIDRYPVTILINGEYYDLEDDRATDCAGRKGEA
jgi:hypothetical protein